MTGTEKTFDVDALIQRYRRAKERRSQWESHWRDPDYSGKIQFYR